jgi:hypothetical protein
MRNGAPYVLGGLAAALAALYFSPSPGTETFDPGLSATPASIGVPRMDVNRSRKGDRLPFRGGRRQVPTDSSVEAIELHDAGLVLRGRNGTLLFRSDPRRGDTVVSRGVVVPEITVPDTVIEVDQHRGAPSTTVSSPPPAAAPGLGTGRSEPAKLPLGCEPPVSAMDNSPVRHTAGRCVASAGAVDLKFLSVAFK